MKIIFFSLALITAASILGNANQEAVMRGTQRVMERSGCSICPTRCDICGKEVHDDEDDESEEAENIDKCGCNKPNKDVRRTTDETKGGCPICTKCEICGKEMHDEADESQEAEHTDKCGCNKPNK